MTEFKENQRFAIERRLGAGGMGVVYRVFDQERRHSVALKTLGQVSAAGIYDLKREFRTLAGIRHPNLVQLHELFFTEGQCYFTMELVSGLPFDAFFRHETVKSKTTLREPQRAISRPKPGRDSVAAAKPTLKTAYAAPDDQLLRRCCRQLAEAVYAIHSAGKLHRDLKPSNILVTSSGRVVVLDFGLVQQLEPTDPGTSYQERLVAGTPAYMAPEQAAGQNATAASDWYSVGVLLYQTLNGRLPFEGTSSEVLSQKQKQEAPSIDSRKGLNDLTELAYRLLKRAPEQRPKAPEILSLLGSETETTVPQTALQGIAFVGRRQQLEALDAAFDTAQAGKAQCVFISGARGSGKTALASWFCLQKQQEVNAIVLQGRCRPRESLPFKAFDTAIDQLSRWLRETDQVTALLPRHTQALTRLFPVLGRVEAIANAPRPRGAEPLENVPRRLAFEALKELLARIADRYPLVLHLDDVQFGDAGSAELLSYLTSSPDAPAMLVIATHDESSDKTAARTLLDSLAGDVVGPEAGVRLVVSSLPLDEATELALTLLPSSARSSKLAQTIAQDADGYPAQIVALCGLVTNGLARYDTAPNKQALRSVLTQRIAALGPLERRFLELLALNRTPLLASEASRALGITRSVLSRLQSQLKSQGLLAVLQEKHEDSFELADESSLELVLEALSLEERRSLHAKLADILSKSDPVHAELVAQHLNSAGQHDRATQFIIRAADDASRAFAFERAIQLLTELLASGALSTETQIASLERQAEAWAHLNKNEQATLALTNAARLASGKRAEALAKKAVLLRSRTLPIDELFDSGKAHEYTLFDGLPRTTVENILAESTLIEGDRDQVLARGGLDASSFFVVIQGALRLQKGEQRSDRLRSGEVLGEVGFLLESTRAVDVCAAEDGTRVLAVSRDSLDELAAENPRLALRLVLNLARIVCSKLVAVRERAFLARSESAKPLG